MENEEKDEESGEETEEGNKKEKAVEKLYVKVSVDMPPSAHFTISINNLMSLKEELEALDEGGTDDVLILQPVRMTEEEFNNLPEFEGF